MRTTPGARGARTAPQLRFRHRPGAPAQRLRRRRDGNPVDPGIARRLMLAAVPGGTFLRPVGRTEHKRSDSPHAQPHVGNQHRDLHQHAPVRRKTLRGEEQDASLRHSMGAILVRFLRDDWRHARLNAAPHQRQLQYHADVRQEPQPHYLRVGLVRARHVVRSDSSCHGCPLGDARHEEIEGRVPECPGNGRTVERRLTGPEQQF